MFLSLVDLVVVFSCSVVSESLWPHGLQYARLLCPSPPPRVCSNSHPSSRWCHPTISSSVIPFSCPQSFPASGSFPVSWLFASGGQTIGASVSASVLPMHITWWKVRNLQASCNVTTSPTLLPWTSPPPCSPACFLSCPLPSLPQGKLSQDTAAGSQPSACFSNLIIWMVLPVAWEVRAWTRGHTTNLQVPWE